MSSEHELHEIIIKPRFEEVSMAAYEAKHSGNGRKYIDEQVDSRLRFVLIFSFIEIV